jgi:DNA-binding Lrp family transcriptional regulator
MDPDIKALFTVLINGQIQTDRSVNEIAKSVGIFVDAANARFQRLEENLDGLIRAITREHSNGGSHS